MNAVLKPLIIYNGHTDGVFCIAWSPDGKWLASGGRDATVHVWESRTGRLQTTFRDHAFRDHALQVMCLAWSPDGEQIASSSFDEAKVRLWKALNSQPRGICVDPACDDQCLAWSPDGKYLVAGGYEAGLVYRATDSTCIAQYSSGSGGPTAVAWSPNGSQLAFADNCGYLFIRDFPSQHLVWRAKAHSGDITALAYSPNGRYLASCGYDATVQVRESATGKIILVYHGHYSGKRSKARNPWHPRRTVFRTSVAIWSLSWSPDSRYLASASGNTMRDFEPHPVPEHDSVHVWDAETGIHLQTYQAHNHQVRAVAWSPDGTTIASASLDGTAHVWKALV